MTPRTRAHVAADRTPQAEAAWRIRRHAWYCRWGRVCRICGASQEPDTPAHLLAPIELHHLAYTTRGYEPDDHLVSLCKRHHQQITVWQRANPHGSLWRHTRRVIRRRRWWWRHVRRRHVPACPWEVAR